MHLHSEMHLHWNRFGGMSELYIIYFVYLAPQFTAIFVRRVESLRNYCIHASIYSPRGEDDQLSRTRK